MTSPFINLCQPDAVKSCGACCGLYNYADSSRSSLVERLRRRTDLFHRMVAGPEDLASFSARILAAEDQRKRYEVIYCCEYAGFLDPEEDRVGCLLHPEQNGGVDMRHVSFYGQQLCKGHFCPSYHYISPQEKAALISIIHDWYLYGLCVTDIDLVKSYFRLISDGVSEMPSVEKFRMEPLRRAAFAFFSLKTAWPFRSPSADRFGKYFFDGSQYMISHIDYEALGCQKSRFDTIFLSLSSEFRDGGEVKRAEEMIERRIDEFINSYGHLP